jgi:hypothetical protein
MGRNGIGKKIDTTGYRAIAPSLAKVLHVGPQQRDRDSMAPD